MSWAPACLAPTSIRRVGWPVHWKREGPCLRWQGGPGLQWWDLSWGPGEEKWRRRDLVGILGVLLAQVRKGDPAYQHRPHSPLGSHGVYQAAKQGLGQQTPLLDPHPHPAHQRGSWNTLARSPPPHSVAQAAGRRCWQGESQGFLNPSSVTLQLSPSQQFNP